MVSESGSSLTVWVEAEQNDVVGPLADGASHKAHCTQMQMDKTLFDKRIIGYAFKVSQISHID